MKGLNMKQTNGLALGLLLSFAGVLPAVADDTEIFFGRSSDAFNSNPNILFVLDNSGSMNRKDDGFGNLTRMDRLKTAMSLLLDQSSSYNVGLMAFQGWNHGGVIRYPIGYLESDSEDLCNGICPDELIVARPDGGINDGAEHDTSKDVTLDAQTLVMANVIGTETTDTTGGTETTRTALAVADVSEYAPADGSALINYNNQASNRWFYDGVAGNGEGHFAYRFDNINIPAGATVTQARITFTQTSLANQPGNVSAYVRAEATPSPEAYPDGTNGTLSLAERRDPLRSTSTLIPWDPVPPDNSSGASADPTSGTTIDTPDLGSLLTELVSLPGWADGNSMSFLIDPFDSYSPAATDSREVYGSAAGIDQVPVLSYTFTEAPNPDLTTTTVVASSHVDEVTDQNTAGVSRNTGNALSELFYAGNTNEPRQLALRFDNIAIPVGAVIKTAYLTLSTAATTDIPAAATDWQYVDGSGSGSGVDPTSTSGPLDPTTDSTSTTSDTVSINLRAELSDLPDDYTVSTLDTRDYTTTFVNWDNVPATESTDVVSPNISSLVSAVTGLADWTSGDSLSLRLTAPEDHVNTATNLRRILTSTSTEKPQLLITWEPGSTTGSGEVATQTTAIRFSQVHVPPGAQIKSARIIFHSAEANDEATTLEITGEDSPSPLALQAVNNDLGGRSKTTARESWAVESWATIGTAYPTPDLSRIVQEITDIPEWCGGNAMTFFLSGTGQRIAVSADANPIKAPTLE
ncbi:MAG: VWA domain-containing protein, partial [Granulosicoccus sp.]|nr:VWA domain-containing protein [Granulosicoccus sp.]